MCVCWCTFLIISVTYEASISSIESLFVSFIYDVKYPPLICLFPMAVFLWSGHYWDLIYCSHACIPLDISLSELFRQLSCGEIFNTQKTVSFPVSEKQFLHYFFCVTLGRQVNCAFISWNDHGNNTLIAVALAVDYSEQN